MWTCCVSAHHPWTVNEDFAAKLSPAMPRSEMDALETAGRIGQVVLLRAQHGYRRPPGVTIERLLRGEDEVAWAPGLGDAARPAAARLRQALLGWTRTEPVPASEAYARDVPAWRSQADAGEEPAWRPAPSTPLPPHWEVEDGPTGKTRVACVLGYADRSLHSSFRHPSDPSLAVWLCFSDSHLRVARRAVTTARAAPARGWRHP